MFDPSIMSQQPVGMPAGRRVRCDPPPPGRLFARRRESRLLRLSPKIRQMMYHHALAPEMTAYGMENKYTLEQPHLAYVSRKVREECLPIFYAINHLMITVQSDLCPAGFSEKTITRVLDYFAFYWGLIPRRCSLCSVRSIQLFWHDMPFLTCIDHRPNLCVSFGRHWCFRSGHSTRLQVASWETREVEQAVRLAILRSLRAWRASAGHEPRFGISSLRPLTDMVRLCGINCPEAAREVYLSRNIPPGTVWISAKDRERIYRNFQDWASKNGHNGGVLQNGGDFAS